MPSSLKYRTYKPWEIEPGRKSSAPDLAVEPKPEEKRYLSGTGIDKEYPKIDKRIVSRRSIIARTKDGKFYKHVRSTKTTDNEEQLVQETGLPYQPPPGWDSSGKPPKLELRPKKICMPFANPEEEIPRVSPLQIRQEIFAARKSEQISKRDRLLRIEARRGVCQPSYTLLERYGGWEVKEVNGILSALGKYCLRHWTDWAGEKLLLQGGMWREWFFRELIKDSDFNVCHYALDWEFPPEILNILGREQLARRKQE